MENPYNHKVYNLLDKVVASKGVKMYIGVYRLKDWFEGWKLRMTTAFNLNFRHMQDYMIALSKDNKILNNAMWNRSMMEVNDAFACVYSTHYKLASVDLRLSKLFQDYISRLLTTFEEDPTAYKAFISQFGTHFLS